MFAAASFRAPIFYDSDNTGYYLDAAGTSVLGGIVVNGILDIRDNNAQFWRATNGGYQRVDSRVESSFARMHWYGVNSSGGTSNFRHAWYDGSAYFGIDADTGTIAFTRSGGAIITSDGSWRAPIFYDSNDTGYYADPASTSRFNQINYTAMYNAADGNYGIVGNNGFFDTLNSGVAGDQLELCYSRGTFTSTSGSMRAPIFYDRDDTSVRWDGGTLVLRNSSPTIYFRDTDESSAMIHVNSNLFYVLRGGVDTESWSTAANSAWPMYLELNTNNAYFGGLVQAISSHRAPIFYDSNNTGYYLDPAAATSLRTVGDWRSDSGDWTGEFNGKIQYHANNWYFQSANTWEFRRSDSANAFTVSQAGIAYARSDFRAPIFYDNDNTGYYMDPNSTSYLNVVGAGGRIYTGYDSGVTNSISCSEWFRSSGATGWFNASYGGGIWMNDSTYVRVYNSKAFLVDNEILATGNITAYYSDERLKTRIGNISGALDKVLRLDGFFYTENETARELGYDNDRQQVGVSAQKVQEVLPEAVHMAPVDVAVDEDGNKYSKTGENYLTVDYSRIVPLLIEAIKEQQLTISEQSAKINTLEHKLEQLIQKLEG
jgi:hypothetical protein